MNKKAAALATPIVAALIFAGCGGNSSGSESQKRKSFATSTVQCDSKGINSRQGNTGTCVRNGVTYTVVNKAQPLNLEELDAKVLDVKVTRVLHGQSKLPARPKHAWVVVSMQVKNKTSKAYRLGGPGFEQVSLGGGRELDPEAASTVLNDSFFELGKIPAGATKTGKEVFEITSGLERRFKKTKVILGIVNFSDAGFADESKRVGIIRLWK
jgi:hypothetical protein